MTDVEMSSSHTKKRPRPSSPSTADLTLFCCLVGSGTAFSVHISSSDTVDDLKGMIKQKKPNDLKEIDADKLTLFKVSLPEEDDLAQKVEDAVKASKPLRSTTEIIEIFPDKPPKKTIHIAVKLPDAASSALRQEPRDSLLGLRRKFLDEFPTRAPSELAQPSQLPDFPKTGFGYRPPSTVCTVPVTLLHPIFNKFVDDCEHYQPSKEDHAFALELAHAMSGIFKNEKERQTTFIQICKRHGLSLTPSEIVGTRFTTDGDMRCNGFIYGLGELKHEAGSKGAEPVFQAGCYYTAYLKHQHDATKMDSPFPCLGIYLIGPLLGFFGLAFTDQTQLQVLAQPIRFDYHHTDVKQRRTAARYLGAFRVRIRELKDYYDIEIPRLRNLTTRSRSDPRFPCYSHYTALSDSESHEIRYVAQAMSDKLVFFGKAEDSDICIKFVTRYSKEAHLYCAILGIAPTLRGLETLPGGWLMVVMDRVDRTYRPFDTPGFNPRADWAEQMHNLMLEKLHALHKEGYVHGDVRDTNVMVRSDGAVGFMLLDFDWSGRIGKVFYPMNVNQGPGLWRPADVHDEAPIEADHDIEMLHHMFANHIPLA